MPAVHEALAVLATVSPPLKAELVRACVAAVSHDGVVTVGEAELLRAIADCLGCPMPPVLPAREREGPGSPSRPGPGWPTASHC